MATKSTPITLDPELKSQQVAVHALLVSLDKSTRAAYPASQIQRIAWDLVKKDKTVSAEVFREALTSKAPAAPTKGEVAAQQKVADAKAKRKTVDIKAITAGLNELAATEVGKAYTYADLQKLVWSYAEQATVFSKDGALEFLAKHPADPARLAAQKESLAQDKAAKQAAASKALRAIKKHIPELTDKERAAAAGSIAPMFLMSPQVTGVAAATIYKNGGQPNTVKARDTLRKMVKDGEKIARKDVAALVAKFGTAPEAPAL